MDLLYFRSLRVYNSYKKESEFFECVAFGKTAETIAQYVQKGKGLCVEGSLDINEWTDKESGKTRRKYQVKVGSFTFLPKSNDQPATTTVDETGDIPF